MTINHPNSSVKSFLLIFCTLGVLTACRKLDQSQPARKLTIARANYQWGELAINKKTESDVIKYDAAGRVGAVTTYDASGLLIRNVTFAYAGNSITLSGALNDKYELDGEGRVIYHSTEGVQQGDTIVTIEHYTYDADGYLHQVTMALNFNNSIGPVISIISYEVKNGNYVKFALSNVDGGTVTRQYDFTYNTTKKVNSPCAFFAPIFANDSYSNIDKYLNYGTASVNLLTGVSYYITNLDKTVSTGTLAAVSSYNSDNYITGLTLTGNPITGFPLDNISPLPRSVSFIFNK